MTPNPLTLEEEGASGIHTLVRAYGKHLPGYDIEFVMPGDSRDVEVVHAGVKGFDDPGGPNIAMCHGLNWTGDYQMSRYEYETNQYVVDTIRHARLTTVPSSWVARAFQRDMHFTPHILPHGIDWDRWRVPSENFGYVLWNKNRSDVICDPSPVSDLAFRFPRIIFGTTFVNSQRAVLSNIQVIGTQPPDIMYSTVRGANVYLATTKETFGIGILEAMAAGVPVLGYAHGGILDLVGHQEEGYLAEPGNLDDLAEGLRYCLQNRERLGAAARERAMMYDWRNVAPIVAEVIKNGIESPSHTVSVVIPCFNKAATLERAVRSALDQTTPPGEIIIVDDGSTDGSGDIAERISRQSGGGPVIKVLRGRNQGVAHARNRGISESRGDYVVCLDADDAIDLAFISHLLPELVGDNSLGVVYTGLTAVLPNGNTQQVEWPPEYNYDKFLEKQNQVPTCCMFRKEAWRRAGGFRQRYAPHGAGAEDAEFWLRLGAQGWGAKRVTNEGLFLYTVNAGATSENYVEPPWLDWHPWVKDGVHPFASMATPSQMSHDVRAYDNPIVSVVIAVGPGHEKYVINALDSLEAQTLRAWEAIVVDDTVSDELRNIVQNAHPFALYVEAREVSTVTSGLGLHSVGAGKARNIGARNARAPFLLFLDADDWLAPECLERMVDAFVTHKGIIYSNYYGIQVLEPTMDPEDSRDNVLSYDELTRKLVVEGNLPDYDCERAQAQPVLPNPYVWSPVTCLIPSAWFVPFDEQLPSWEDYLWNIQLARQGRCFHHLEERLWVYNFHTGKRREIGSEEYERLANYMHQNKGDKMPCPGGCGQKRSQPQITYPNNQVQSLGADISQAGRINVQYNPPGKGAHMVFGQSLPQTNYGRHSIGDVFPVEVRDILIQPGLFLCPDCGSPFRVDQRLGRVWCDKHQAQKQPEVITEAVVFAKPGDPFSGGHLVFAQGSAPIAGNLGLQVERNPNPDSLGQAVVPDDDLTVVDGIGEATQQKLYDRGVRTVARLRQMNEEALRMFGVPPANSARVRRWLDEHPS
jgi:glycosyltransferase involved in cell wall biosynthesis